MSLKIPKFTFRLIKLVVFCLLAYSIYKQFFSNEKLSYYWYEFEIEYTPERLICLVTALLLMPVNLNLEAYKWRRLIRHLETFTQFNAFKAICSGITLSMFTPNRIGEFGGRVLLLRKASKIQGAGISLVGSLSQLVASFSIGLIGMSIYLLLQPIDSTVLFIFAGLFFLIPISIYAYFNISFLLNFLSKFKRLSKFKHHLQPISEIHRLTLHEALYLSAFRHFIFTIQYILIFWFFGVGMDVSFIEMFILVLSIFFVQTVTPSIALVELGIRGSIALFFMDMMSRTPLSILIASLCLWTINLMIPSLLGMWIIFRLNLRKTILNEDQNSESQKSS